MHAYSSIDWSVRSITLQTWFGYIGIRIDPLNMQYKKPSMRRRYDGHSGRLTPQRSMFLDVLVASSNVHHVNFAWMMWVICIFNKLSWNFFFFFYPSMFGIQFHFLLGYLTSSLWATGFFIAFQCNVRKHRLFTVYFPFSFWILVWCSFLLLYLLHFFLLPNIKNALILTFSNDIKLIEKIYIL